MQLKNSAYCGALLGAIVLGLSGCTRVVWDKAGSSQQDFQRDSYACERDARQSGYFGGGLLGAANFEAFQDRCMGAAGWTKRRVPIQ
jgi:hypothetical protein